MQLCPIREENVVSPQHVDSIDVRYIKECQGRPCPEWMCYQDKDQFVAKIIERESAIEYEGVWVMKHRQGLLGKCMKPIVFPKKFT